MNLRSWISKTLDRQRAFEDALLQEPWDTVTRLVYADWLDEHGQDGLEQRDLAQAIDDALASSIQVTERELSLHGKNNVSANHLHDVARVPLRILDERLGTVQTFRMARHVVYVVRYQHEP